MIIHVKHNFVRVLEHSIDKINSLLKMEDIEEIIDLYARIPTFYPDYKSITDKMPPSMLKRAFDQLLNIYFTREITEKVTRLRNICTISYLFMSKQKIFYL